VRVALVLPSFPKLSETFMVAQFLGLLDRGLDVHVVCRRSDPREWANFPGLDRPGIRRRIHVKWPSESRALASLLLPAALARGLAGAPGPTSGYLKRGIPKFGTGVLRRFYLDLQFLQLHPDVIHFEFGSLAAGRMHLGDLLGCGTVVSFRGYDLNRIGVDCPGFYDDVWKNADAIHTLGDDLWTRALRHGCPPDKRHVLIPPAVDCTVYAPDGQRQPVAAGTASRPLRILSVGRLVWEKGYEYAIQAVALLKERGIRCEYRIAGTGGHAAALGSARGQLGLGGDVFFLGGVSPSEVRSQMNWADVLLHAAVSEGFCNAVLEAQAMTLPVVCTDAGGLPENVVEGETGCVVHARDPEALAARLAMLARQPELRTRMGKAGRARAETRFRPAAQIDAFERLYSGVLGTRSRTLRTA
jgi:colanic acid/amylovoran biosynthesis glycosyltransferase